MIVTNCQAYKNQYDHFNALYNNARVRAEKRNQMTELGQKNLFVPRINPKSDAISETFLQRLERTVAKRKALQ